MLACSFYWVSPRFENVRHPPSIYLIAWTIAMLTLLIIIASAVHTIVKFIMEKVGNERTTLTVMMFTLHIFNVRTIILNIN